MNFTDEFTDEIKALTALLDGNKDHVFTEEATKMALVIPFLEVLGYNVSDPKEVEPESTADFADKKGDKVDYAIRFNEVPMILIEVKCVRTKLQSNHMKQASKYFAASPSRFAILTNGIQYQFFADLEKTHIMDAHPFLTLDIVQSIRSSEILELQKFHKKIFDAEIIIEGAKLLKYTGEIKGFLREQIKEPGEDFTKFFIKQTSFRKNNKTVNRQAVKTFSEIVANAFEQYSQEVVSGTPKGAIDHPPDGSVKPEPVIDNLCLRFWTQLLEYAKTKTNLHSKLSPSKGGWISTGAGVSGFAYCYNIKKHLGTVELFISRGKDSKTENKKIFEKLSTAKKEIEQSFGEQLEWEPLENKQACRIKKTILGGGYLDEQEWPKIQKTMVDAMIRLEKALNPQIRLLKSKVAGA